MSPTVTLILQIDVIIIAARAVGLLFRLINQPQVIGEIAAGILLGPSLLGWTAPKISAVLFPPSSLGYLDTFSQVGIVIYMFLVGVALNFKELKNSGHAALLTSHASIIAPFVLGALLALMLYPRLSDDSVSFLAFALFMGAAMSVTAFAILARILTDRAILGSRVGTMAIACGAVDDITGWCILAYIVVLMRTQAGSKPVWITIAGTIVFVLLMIYAAKPLVRRFYTVYERQGKLSEYMIASLILFVLISALITDWLGLHLLIGAFLCGAIMPKECNFVLYVFEKFESVTVVLLLPLFFAFTGLRMNVRSLGGRDMWFFCASIILVAIAGKLGGSMIAARAAGVPWREAAGIGILMNTRGLMELIILNIGLDIGVISPVLFSMMVLMTLVTTFMTSPLLYWIYPLRRLKLEMAPGPETTEAIFKFMEKQGADWGMRYEVATKACSAIDEVMIAIRQLPLQSPTARMAAEFDEFKLEFEIDYEGPPLPLPETAPSAEMIADPLGEIALAGFLIRQHADEVKVTSHEGHSHVHLHFEH
ncbi:MAG: cation:proton antiporter [Terriglobia bacterium]